MSPCTWPRAAAGIQFAFKLTDLFTAQVKKAETLESAALAWKLTPDAMIYDFAGKTVVHESAV